MGWPNPSIDADIYGQNKNDGFTDSVSFQTLLNMGACVGAFVPILVADNYGRRFSFFCSAVSCSIFWISVAIAVNEMVKVVYNFFPQKLLVS